MCVSQNKNHFVTKKYNLNEYKNQYDSVNVYFIKQDFIEYISNKQFENVKLMSINIFVCVHNFPLMDVMSNKHLKITNEIIDIEFIKKNLDDSFDFINWEYIFKNKNFDTIKITVSSV